eukprot:11155228-Lingulodinium_polyedra.AAC.1
MRSPFAAKRILLRGRRLSGAWPGVVACRCAAPATRRGGSKLPRAVAGAPTEARAFPQRLVKGFRQHHV